METLSSPPPTFLQRLNHRAGRLSLTGCWLMAAGAALADQASKAAIIAWVGPADEITIIPGFLRIIHRVNTGAAFSSFDEHPLPLLIFASLVAAGMILWSVKLKPGEEALRWPLGLIIGGAIGNLIDRIRLGHVTDFIDAHWRYEHHFPTFNVADSAISVGMALLILFSFTAAKPAEG